MKKFFYTLLAAMTALTMVTFTSCSKDKDDDVTISDFVNAKWEKSITESGNDVIAQETSKVGVFKHTFTFNGDNMTKVSSYVKINCINEAYAKLFYNDLDSELQKNIKVNGKYVEGTWESDVAEFSGLYTTKADFVTYLNKNKDKFLPL